MRGHCIALTLCAVLLLTGCGPTKEPAIQTNETAASEMTETNQTTEPSGWNGQAYEWPDGETLASMPRRKSIADPFAGPDGTRAETAEAFDAQRAYLRAALEHYIYGRLPEPAKRIEPADLRETEILDGRAIQRQAVLIADGRHRMEIRFTYPKDADHLPLIMRLDYLCDAVYRPVVEDEALQAGTYAFCTVSRRDIAPDTAQDRASLPYGAEGPGAVAMWAYAAMCTLDYLWDAPQIDQTRVALTGHSRDGKAAICAAAMDERFAAVIANGSGCGGAGSFYTMQPGSEGLATMIHAFPHWLSGTLLSLTPKAMQRIPVDMIFARALIAPRHVLLTEARGDAWANPYGAYVNTLLARDICTFLGSPGTRNGMTIREGTHNQLEEDWRYLMSFLDDVFYHIPAEIDWNAEHFDVSALTLDWKVPDGR